MLKQPHLFPDGYQVVHYPLSETALKFARSQQWKELDAEFRRLTTPEGELFQFLRLHHDFDSIEFIISLRDAEDPDQEDGIWHDDGSRQFSFSLSLTEIPIEGGILGMRRIGETEFKSVPTPPLGEMILFLTGTYGFEHKIHRVTQGKRLMIVGWCSKQ